MSQATVENQISELRRAVQQAAGEAFLVEPRVIRRLVRELHGFARLSSRIPHTESQIVSLTDVQLLTHPDELGLETFGGLPNQVLLIAHHEEQDLESSRMQDAMLFTWRRLFHGVIDLHLKRASAAHRLERPLAESRIAEIGQVEFDEVHAVFRNEMRLVHPESRIEAYAEFVAVYNELLHFSPDQIPVWFPSLAGRNDITDVLNQDVDAEALYNSSRLYGAPIPDLTPGIQKDEVSLSNERRDWTEFDLGARPSRRRYLRLLKRRQRVADRGNSVAAGVAAIQAADSATNESDREDAIAAAQEDMQQLVDRLQGALNFSDTERDEWQESLCELLKNSTRGFWNADKKLLFDLQKVCLDHERVTFRVDLVKWIVSRGKRPLRRPLTSMREVMMAKHLASSTSRLPYVRLSGQEREQLASLIHSATHLAEEQMRERMRPAIQETLQQVGLAPSGIPEEVAFDKLTEEALDCIAERGYLTMGYLRDAISRNDLKLPDLTDPKDLIRGDHLLRSDDRLDVALDGVYRRGEFYLRWLQVISSIFFGTRTGRFATLFLIIPFGGAKVLVDGVHHIAEVFTGHDAEEEEETDESAETEDSINEDDENPDDGTSSNDSTSDGDTATVDSDSADNSGTESQEDTTTTSTDILDESNQNSVTELQPVDVEFEADAIGESETILIEHTTPPKFQDNVDQHFATLPYVILIGVFLMAVIHLPSVRSFATSLTNLGWRLLKFVAYQVPLAVIRMPFMQLIWKSRWFIRMRRFFLNPLLFSWLGCQIIPRLFGNSPLNVWWTISIAALMSAAVNSRLGRDVEELTSEWVGNVWYDLRARVVMALFDWIVDFFKWLLNMVERFIYAVDEWLRFHSGETILTVVLKACLGVVWSLVVFLIRVYVNLLIEPQVNPIKHFPVVTVAHKIMLPFFPYITEKGGLLFWHR